MDGNTALLWPRTRGWDDVHCVTPHGWTAAELFLLLRDCLVHEIEGGIAIGAGVPEEWGDRPIRVENLPTYFGPMSLCYDPVARRVEVTVGTRVESVRNDLPFPCELVVHRACE